MILLFLPILIAAAVAAWAGARLLARQRQGGRRAHSRPGQFGAWAMIWTVVPALAVLIGAALLTPIVENGLIASGAPEAVAELEPLRRAAFFADARAVGAGHPAAQVWAAPHAELLPAEGARLARIGWMLELAGLVLAGLAALLGALFAFHRIRPDMRARNRVEGWIVGLLFASSAVAVLTTIGIVA